MKSTINLGGSIKYWTYVLNFRYWSLLGNIRFGEPNKNNNKYILNDRIRKKKKRRKTDQQQDRVSIKNQMIHLTH